MNSYNNDLNQNNPSESKDPAGGYASYPQQNQPYGQTTQQTQQTAYTWPPRQQPMYYPPQPVKPKEKKKGGHFGLKLLAVVLACAVTSFASLGVFVGLIQRGVVAIEPESGSTDAPALTLYKRAESTPEQTGTVTLESMSQQEIAEKMIPSVVCVQNYQVSPSYGFFFGYGYSQENGGELTPAGEGSGIVLSKDGYIVTNQHVVDGATSLKVVTSEGLTYEAELVGEDTQTDLAVIKVNTEDELTPAQFGSSSDLRVMDAVMAIGNPGGMQLNSSVTFGYVSALDREVTNSDTGYSVKCIQTDAAINPGNSGGALVDMNGLVVGINSSKIVATGYEGLGFAIPSDLVQPIVSDLMQYGYVKDRAAPGFSGQYIDQLTAGFYGMNAGYYVTRVTSREAEDAGLMRGDMITAIDGTQIVSASTISSYLVNKKPGDTVTLTVDRSATGRQSGQLELVLSENTGISE